MEKCLQIKRYIDDYLSVHLGQKKVKQFYLTGEVLLNPVSAHSSCLGISGLLGQNRRDV